jgi:hypothetical protein
VTALVQGSGPSGANASSHREAPLISEDPSADNTDLYAFRSPDKPDTLTIVSNFIPAATAIRAAAARATAGLRMAFLLLVGSGGAFAAGVNAHDSRDPRNRFGPARIPRLRELDNEGLRFYSGGVVRL